MAAETIATTSTARHRADEEFDNAVSGAVPHAPLGTVIRKITADLAGFIHFDCAVRGALVSEKGTGMNYVHVHENGSISPVKQHYACPVCPKTGPVSDFQQGVKKGEGYVLVPPSVVEKHEAADEEHKGQLSITVHQATEVVHAVPNGKVYYLAPSKTTNSHYANLAEVMLQRPELSFVGVLNTHGTAYRYLLTSDGRTITLVQLAEPDVVRERPVANVPANATAEKMAALVDALVEPFHAQVRASKRAGLLAQYVAEHEPAALALPAAKDGEQQAPGQAAPTALDPALDAALEKLGITNIASRRKGQADTSAA